MLLQSLLRPVLTPLMRGMFDAPIFSSSAWSPLALWPDGIATPGMWISPRTLTSQWQDYTGTTPVSVPGTVADASNPVGLALDIRAGAPEVLGPELNNNSWTTGTGWSLVGTGLVATACPGFSVCYLSPAYSSHPVLLHCVLDVAISSCGVYIQLDNGLSVFTLASGHNDFYILCRTDPAFAVFASGAGFTGSISNISVREVTGNHMLQSTSVDRPLLSARRNLLTYSEDFSNAAWTYFSSTRNGLTTAPDGTSTAQLVTLNSQYAYVSQNTDLTLPSGTTQLWIKRISGNTELYLRASTSGIIYSAPITITDSWVKYSAAWTSDGNTFDFVLQDRNASGQGQIAIWHPQLNFGPTALPYQRVGAASDYDSTGFPIAQIYNGTNSGMATAAFAAGTLINGVDCMIAVRRDSAAACVAGLYNGIADATKFFGMAESASGSGCVGSGAGTPTVWVDNTQLTGGTAVTRGTLHTALTVGDWHILEFRNLDLSTWTAAGFGLYTSYVFPGPRGDIMLYPSTASTTDKDAARQWLADYYGVTLP